jgi:hypothetical protein
MNSKEDVEWFKNASLAPVLLVLLGDGLRPILVLRKLVEWEIEEDCLLDELREGLVDGRWDGEEYRGPTEILLIAAPDGSAVCFVGLAVWEKKRDKRGHQTLIEREEQDGQEEQNLQD